jgi:hypothetical protein
MSVSGVPSVPGFDVLFPSSSTSAPSTGTSSGTSSSSPTSGLASNVPGSDVLNAPLNTETVPGFDVLQPASYFPGESNSNSNSSSSTSSGSGSNSSGSSSGSGASASVNPYQQAYDNIETWSDSYLMSSIENGAPGTLPELSGGESAGAFAGLSQTIAALKPLAQLNAAAGVGTSSATPASTSTGTSSSTPNTDVGSIVNALA